MSSNVLILEQFAEAEADSTNACRQKERAAEYEAGFAAGEAAAHARATEQNHQLQAAADAINQRLANFDDTAAAFLCEALIKAVKELFPSLCRRFFAKEAAATLSDFFGEDGEASLVLRASSEKADVVRAAIAALPLADRASVEEDDRLTEFEVRAEWRHGGISFDLERAVSKFISKLETAGSELKDEDGND